MKRLQFRHNREVFQHRADVLKYFADIVDATNTASTIFNSSLYAEPLVAKYLDEDGNQQIILAIGVDSGLTPYHIIDSKEIAERLDANKEAIEAEVKRATEAETVLEGAITAETKRALEAELFLSGAVETERSERIAADIDIKTQIDKNIASIVPVTENLGANVREEYALKNAVGEELGSHIKIYKDSALVGAEVNYKGATGVTINDEGKFEFNYSGEADKSVEYLYLIYRNEEGGLNLVALDFENFLMETEEGYGIKIVDHKITINIKAGDKYLKVSEDGLQTINIDEAIKTAVDTLSEDINAKVDAEIERATAADNYISALTAEFSAATVNEFILVNSALTTEITNGDKAVRESYEAADAVLQGAIQAETKNREDADATLLSTIQAEAKNREDADANLVNQINQEVSARTQDVLSISTKLTALEGVDASLDTKVNTLSASVLTEISIVKKSVAEELTTAFTNEDTKVLEASKTYTDDAVKDAVDGINTKKVTDVAYDNGNKKIYLTFADGTLSNGFDASEFVVDGMLNSVTFDNNANTIKFVWNTSAGIEEMIVPLDKFVDQYTVSVDSVSFLKISDDNQISAIVDNADGFVNTLASTNYVQSIVEGAQQILSANTYNSLTELKDYVNTLSGSILTHINTADNTILSAITKNETAIAVLNADKKTEGSVLYRIENEFEKSLITDGVPVTAVSPEDANKVHSLIRQIAVNGEMRYYVMSDATEMFYVKPRATETAPIETVNLNDYITSLETRVAVLEEKLTGFAGNMEQTMKDLIKSYLNGTENEIKITETDDKLTIGFDDNAIFGEI